MKPSRRPSYAPFVLLTMVLGLACVQGTRAPSVTPRGTLSLRDEGAGGAYDGKFGVVFASPKGEAREGESISVVFNRPLRALEVAGEETPFVGKLTPAIPGRWQWVGSSAATFVPEARPGEQQAGLLPGATEFTIEIPAGTAALDGSVLDEPFRSTFVTPRPRVVRSAPSEGEDGLKPVASFELRFNQGVRDDELQRGVTLRAADKPVAFSVERPDVDNPKLVTIRPSSPLPLDAPIEIGIAESLKGIEGPLPTGEPQLLRYRTYGPLRVTEWSCDKSAPGGLCDARAGMSLELSNAVKIADLKRNLVVVPAVAIQWPSYYDDDETTRYAYLHGPFEHGKSYTFRIKGGPGGITDEHGQKMAGDFADTMKMGDRWPIARLGLYGRVFEPKARGNIPVASINVAELEIATAPVAEKDLLTIETVEYEAGRPPTFEQILSLPGAKNRKVASAAAKNQVTTHQVRPADALGGAGKRGPVALGLRYRAQPGTDNERVEVSTAIVQITDLAISAKVSRRGSLVWVTSLSTAAPVADAQVTIRRPGAADVSFSTDKDGFVRIPKEKFVPADQDEDAVVIVRKDDDWAFRYVSESLDGWRFGIPWHGLGSDRPFGMVFSDRGIYRPGDVVRLKGIARADADAGTATPGGQRVSISVDSPEGEEILKTEKTLSAFGTFAVDVRVPKGGKLGTYSVSATVGSSPYDFGDLRGDFEVAEYRPAEFEVAVESSRPSFIRGDEASWTARGDFLFGAPMSGAEADVYVHRQSTRYAPPGLEEHVTDDVAYTYDLESETPSSTIEQAQGKLDAGGTFGLRAKLTMPGQSGPEVVIADATVTDLSRQQISSSTTAVVHPAEFYVGLRERQFFVSAGTTLRPEVLAARPDGAKVLGERVQLDLIRRKWVVAKQATGGGEVHNVSNAVDETVVSCAVVTQKGPQSCALTPPSAGYYLVRATSKDKRGNLVASSTSVYVTGAGATSWGDSDSLAVELVANKKSYEVGDTAKILVKSPFASAEALVTVERGGVRTERRTTLSGPTPTLEIPVTADLRPNAYVSVLLVRGRSKPAPTALDAADVGAPAFRMGYAEIPLNPEARRLKVALTPNKTNLLPGETVEVAMKVTDKDDKPAPAEITLYAVDEGVLSLVGYKTPDPIPVFGAPRDLEVQTLESRMALAKTFHPFGSIGIDKGLDGGGGADSALGAGVRRDFRAAAYFNPSIVTDASGVAKASFKLPEQLTTFRVMAVVASTDDRFGFADKRVTTSRPLMARPALPRFLRAGDTLSASVIVTSKGHPTGEVDVGITVSGLELEGESKQRVHLEEGKSVEVRFPLAAKRVGDAKIGFVVKGGGASDAVEVERRVEAPISMEAVALYGETSTQSAERLGDLSSIRPDVGGLEVELASTALVGLDSGAEQLIDYPYGCTEQLVSRLVPMLPLRELAKDFRFPIPANTDAVVETTVAKILTHQRPDGGFGFWSGSPQASAWVTAYALWGLGEAKKRGARVTEGNIDSAVSFLRRELERSGSAESLATSPFVLYVLAELGQPDAGRTTRLYERREELPLFGKALLLHAMVLTKADREAIGTLTKELENALQLDGPLARAVDNHGDAYAVLLDSNTRTSALVLRAILAAEPKHALGSRLAKGLLADRDGGAWRSTQETAWALLALADYRTHQETVEPDFEASLYLGEAELLRATFAGRSVEAQRETIPAMKLVGAKGAPLAFDVDGKGKLFYEARLRYAKKKLPAKPLERGFYVEKRFRRVTPESLAAALATTPDRTRFAFGGGDLVLADIVVVTGQPRHYVVIDSPLPAGFEAVDTRLATTSGRLDVDAAEPSKGYDDDERAKGEAFNSSWFLREVRDDRVLFFVDHMAAGMYRYRYLARATSLGRFMVPPTKAEAMYSPEVFGRTAGEAVVISDPGGK